MTIETRTLIYADGDTALEAFVAWDGAWPGPRPGVLVAHAWAGRGKFEDEIARRLARLGYVGFALDVYGQGVLGSGPDENAALMQPFLDDRALLQRRLALALEQIRGLATVDAGRVAATGYCFGGLAVLDLARTGADVLGAVSFHGLFNPPGNTEGNVIKAKVLALHGWDDPMVPPEAVVGLGGELSGAGADWQIHAYGGTLHAFTNPEANAPDMGAAYHSAADRRSWQAMENFLAELFG